MSTRDDIEAALVLSPEERAIRLTEIAEDLFIAAYDERVTEDSNDELTVDDLRQYSLSLSAAIDHTTAVSDPDLVAAWMEKAAENAAVVASAPLNASFTWFTQEDERVRELHEPMHGVTVAAGKPFIVGGHPLMYPGQPIGPPEVWINCRCGLTVGAGVVTAASDPDPPRGAVVVATLADPPAVAVDGGDDPDDLHVTLGYYGHADEAPDTLRPALENWLSEADVEPFDAKVNGRAFMGNDEPQAATYLLEHPEFNRLRTELEAVAKPKSDHPHFTPHMTIGYGINHPDEMPQTIRIGGVEIWWAGERIGREPLTAAISEEPWSKYSAADYSIEQWRKACLIHMPGGDPESKGTYKVPVLTPSGAVSRAGVHAAAAALAGARGGVNAPADQKAKARSRLRGLYRLLKEDPPDSLKAAGPVNTHDAPGWITNPRETERLRRYWTRGEGAAKIKWGAPGDFDRCRDQLRKYIHNPAYLDGTCANMHYVALGFWPGQAPHGRKKKGLVRKLVSAVDTGEETVDIPDDTPELREVLAAFTLCASLEDTMEAPPLELFTDPGLDKPTAITVRAAGEFNEVVGHIASWDTCHVGFGEKNCVTAPKSTHDYAYFRTGEVMTSGGAVSVGHLTAGTGHASAELDPRDTVRHYDDTGTVVADVAVGEDEFGIWVHGIERPGITQEQSHALRAGAPSGDWRRIGGNLELVGALIVNVPGFPIPRPQLAASAADETILLALTAAAIVVTDPNALDEGRIAVRVVDEVERRAEARARAARAAAVTASINAERVKRLHERVGV